MQYNCITTAILKYIRFLHVDRTYVNYFLILVYLFFFQGVLPFEKCPRNFYKLLNDIQELLTKVNINDILQECYFYKKKLKTFTLLRFHIYLMFLCPSDGMLNGAP